MNQPNQPPQDGSPVPPSSAESPASVTLGEILRQARERQALTLDEVARRTRLPKRHLEALEQNSLAGLPPGMYQRAEVRAYAEAIGLDPQLALVALGRTQAAPPPAVAARPTQRVRAARARRTRRRVRFAWMTVLTLAVMVGVASFLWWRQPPDIAAIVAPSTAEVQAVPPSVRTDAAADRQPGGATDTAAPAPSPNQGGDAPQVFDYPDLRVITEPPGARVTVDGVGWGQSPVTIRALPAGARLVRVTLDGYAAQERRVAVPDDAPRTTVRMTLKPVR